MAAYHQPAYAHPHPHHHVFSAAPHGQQMYLPSTFSLPEHREWDRSHSPASDVSSTSPGTQPRKVANTFMMYKNDFPLRYPEVCALEKAPSQRMRIAARLWEHETPAVRDEYERRYRAALLASGAKGGEADPSRRKARSDGVTAARRAKRASEGAVLAPRSEIIVRMWCQGLRGDALIRVVRDWEAANMAEAPAKGRKKAAAPAKPAHYESPTPSPPTTPPTQPYQPAIALPQLVPIHGQMPTSYSGYRSSVPMPHHYQHHSSAGYGQPVYGMISPVEKNSPYEFSLGGSSHWSTLPLPHAIPAPASGLPPLDMPSAALFSGSPMTGSPNSLHDHDCFDWINDEPQF